MSDARMGGVTPELEALARKRAADLLGQSPEAGVVCGSAVGVVWDAAHAAKVRHGWAERRRDQLWRIKPRASCSSGRDWWGSRSRSRWRDVGDDAAKEIVELGPGIDLAGLGGLDEPQIQGARSPLRCR